MRRYEKIVNVPQDVNGTIFSCRIGINSSPEFNTRESLQYLDVDESYVLNFSSELCSIESATIWGAMHGMETFTQLLERDSVGGAPSCKYSHVVVTDSPRFTHRGLMIDTVRVYLLIEFA